MSKEQYDMLMTELAPIASKLKLFPSHVQRDVFRAAYSTLMDGRVVDIDDISAASQRHGESQIPGVSDIVREPVQMEASVWNEAEELSKLAEEFGLREKDGVEFGAAVVYFYTVLAPMGHRVESITLAQFEEACLTVGHSVGNPLAALNNAKRKNKKYLQGGKRDGFSLTGHGKYYVKNNLLKQSDS